MYAQTTSVPVERTKAEIDRLLGKHGAEKRSIGTDGETAIVHFMLGRSRVRLRIPLPQRNDRKFVFLDPSNRYSYERGKSAADKMWQQATRARWRGVLLLLKAKLEAIEIGLSTPEREFLADIFLPDGRTVHEALVEPLEQMYLSGETPMLLNP